MPRWTNEQQEAIDKSGCNIIVSAGAGSGKTAVLSQRVLQKIESGIHVNELLILTFTKAAASEMKDRIRKKIASNPELKDELNLLNSSYITTFDSFALSVLKKYHYMLNISREIGITEEAIVKTLETKILNELFEELYEGDNHSFKELVNKYCGKNDKNLRSVITKLYENVSSCIDKEKFYLFLEEGFYRDEYLDLLIDKYKDLLNDKRELVKLELENCSYYLDSSCYEKLAESVNNLLTSPVEDLHLITTVKAPRLSGLDDTQKEVRELFKKAYTNLLELASYGSFEEIKDKLKLSRDFVLEIVSIIKKFDSKMSEYKLKHNIYTFNDVAMSAIKILKENEEARLELKNSFKEIMIDEYQDTNDIQETFISMIANDNVYMVGDIKQSIYRFRGSNPSIFKDKYDNYSSNDGGYKIDLIKNFRSRSEVLDNINVLFELLMDNEIGGAEYRVSHEMVYGNTAYDNEKFDGFDYNMKILEYENSKESGFSDYEVEIFSIASDIKNKMDSGFKVFDKESSAMRDATYSDFVIILDRSKYFSDFKKIFEYLHIPLTVLKDEDLKSSTDISLIKNLFDFVYRVNNNDFGVEFKYDFVSIARSFLYEYSDSYILEIITNNNFKETSIYKEFSSISSINSKSLGQLYNEILSITDFYNKIYKIGDYENINVRIKKIYDMCISLNDLGYSLIDFCNYLDEIINNDKIKLNYSGHSGSGDSVKILTIHKSKGLEYPVCYFADLNHDFNTTDLKDLFILDNTYGMIVPKLIEDSDENFLKELYKYEFFKEEIGEKIRLFYVALTRAREQMVIVLPYKETRNYEKDSNGVISKIRRISFKRLSDLIYGVKNSLPKYFEKIDISKLGLTKKYLYKKDEKNIDVEETSIIKVREVESKYEVMEESHFSKENNKLIDKTTLNNMEYGTRVHEILELIDFGNPNYDLIHDEFIKSKVRNLLNHEIFKNIKDATLYKEYEFIYMKDNINYHGIIDLVCEFDSYINIVDYKLKNVVDDNYKKQLLGYKEYIESISDKKVNLYLFSIIDGEVNKIEI